MNARVQISQPFALLRPLHWLLAGLLMLPIVGRTVQAEEPEELCGWVSLGTHDSIPVDFNEPFQVSLPLEVKTASATEPPSLQLASTPVNHCIEVPAAQPVAEPTSSSDCSLSALIALVASNGGISTEQMLEPLAMVGPYLDDSLGRAQQIKQWWNEAMVISDRLTMEQECQKEAEAFLQEQLNQIASEEPVDIESLGPSVIVEQLTEVTPPAAELEVGIEITPIDRTVGSTVVIATLEEAYQPYDLATEDLRLWSVLPVSSHPVCIRGNGDRFDAADMWHAFDDQLVGCPPPPKLATESPPPRSPPTLACGSPDCLLDEFIWKVQRWTEPDSPAVRSLRGEALGRRVASVTVRGNQWLHRATSIVAQHWPQAEAAIEPSEAGRQLLARAEAIVAEEAVEIAERPDEAQTR